MEKPASKNDSTKISKMQYKLFSFLVKTLNRKKQWAQRKILRMGRILSVPF